MSKPIEVGCWAIYATATPCCARFSKNLKRLPFIVTSIEDERVLSRCSFCGTVHVTLPVAYGYLGDPWQGLPIVLLKRIDDPGEETEEREEIGEKA